MGLDEAIYLNVSKLLWFKQYLFPSFILIIYTHSYDIRIRKQVQRTYKSPLLGVCNLKLKCCAMCIMVKSKGF